tara:strand:- start:1670 stop:1837 length:168 start_codon:yes stop_codon:yes gene_type:complete
MIRGLIILILISSCSTNYNNTNLENFDYDQNISIEEFKKKIIKYGKISKYPDINK